MLFKELSTYLNQTQVTLHVAIGIIVALYNFLLIYKRATTYVVVDTDKLKEGVNEND